MRDRKISRRQIIGSGGLLAAALLVAPFSAHAARGFKVTKTADEWRRQLGNARFNILREGATERPYSSPLNDEHRTGIFVCAGCTNHLFSSTAKFDSKTGWPSFFQPLQGAIATKPDRRLGFERTEVLCADCGGHLGHVFEDGPKPTGLRYCMNGLALRFRARRRRTTSSSTESRLSRCCLT